MKDKNLTSPAWQKLSRAIADCPAGMTPLVAAIAHEASSCKGSPQVREYQEELWARAKRFGYFLKAGVFQRKAIATSSSEYEKPLEERGTRVTQQLRRPLREFSQEERDSRRAKTDLNFRRELGAKLAKQINQLSKTANRMPKTALEAAARLLQRQELIKEIKGLNEKRKELIQREVKAKFKLLPVEIVELTRTDVNKDLAKELNFQGKQWEVIGAAETKVVADIDGHFVWKDSGRPAHTYVPGSKGTEYFRAHHEIKIRSVALLVNQQCLSYVLHDEQKSIQLPDGYYWEVKSGGVWIRKVQSSCALRLSAKGLRKGKVAPFITELEALYAEQLRFKAAQAAEFAAAQGIEVGVVDSIAANNCKKGTSEFVKKFNLDESKFYPAQHILQLAIGTEYLSYVRRAIMAAISRHRQMEKAALQGQLPVCPNGQQSIVSSP